MDRSSNQKKPSTGKRLRIAKETVKTMTVQSGVKTGWWLYSGACATFYCSMAGC